MTGTIITIFFFIFFIIVVVVAAAVVADAAFPAVVQMLLLLSLCVYLFTYLCPFIRGSSVVRKVRHSKKKNKKNCRVRHCAIRASSFSSGVRCTSHSLSAETVKLDRIRNGLKVSGIYVSLLKIRPAYMRHSDRVALEIPFCTRGWVTPRMSVLLELFPFICLLGKERTPRPTSARLTRIRHLCNIRESFSQNATSTVSRCS